LDSNIIAAIIGGLCVLIAALIGVIFIQDRQKIEIDNPRGGFRAGKRLSFIRRELNLSYSEIIDAIKYESEQKYIEIEKNEREAPIEVLENISQITGVSLASLKHGGGKRFMVESIDWFTNPQKAASSIATEANDLIYLTIAATTSKTDFPIWRQIKDTIAKSTDRYLHLGLLVQVAQYKYKIYNLNVSIEYLIGFGEKRLAAFFDFIDCLHDLGFERGYDFRYLIVSRYKDDAELYKGYIHPARIVHQYWNGHGHNFIFELFSKEATFLPEHGQWGKELYAKVKDFFG
jgi:transcriptional regulator with XRE-family HTH domain